MLNSRNVLGFIVCVMCLAGGACQSQQSSSAPATPQPSACHRHDQGPDVVGGRSVGRRRVVVGDHGRRREGARRDDAEERRRVAQGAPRRSHPHGGRKPAHDSWPQSGATRREIRDARRRARTRGDGRLDREGSAAWNARATRLHDTVAEVIQAIDAKTATKCSSSERRSKRLARTVTSSTGIPTRSYAAAIKHAIDAAGPRASTT